MLERPELQAELLQALRKAGGAGAGDAKLVGKKQAGERASALEELVSSGEVKRFGPPEKSVYLLAGEFSALISALKQKLEAAGKQGLKKAAVAGKGSAKFPTQAALQALLDSGAVRNLGTGPSPIYLIAAWYQPAEIACEWIEAKATPGQVTLFKEAHLWKGAKGAVADAGPEAVRRLVASQRLIPARAGKTVYYLHTASLAPLFAAGGAVNGAPHSAAPAASALNPAAIRAAYDDLARESGFADVLISELHRRVGGPLDALQQWLRTKSREGVVLPGRGDWTIAEPEARAAAISIAGEPHLRIRFT